MEARKRRHGRRGPQSFKGKSKIPKGAGLDTQIQHEKNQMRTDSTMAQLRVGFTKMFKVIPLEMKKMNIKPPGSYDKNNAHGGVMWGWAGECNMTDKKAKRILFKLYASRRVTANELKNVRKTLGYAYELKGGSCKKNWPSTRGLISEAFNLNLLPKGRAACSTKPTKIPTPEQLKRAFTKPWKPGCKMPLAKWVVAYVAAYDWCIFGCRSREDIGRVKFSTNHALNVRERWQASEFKDGRCKLCGDKKGTRPWWVWRVCLCPGQCHVSPPADFGKHLDYDGNPKVEVRWNTACPIACYEFYNSCLRRGDVRNYPRWKGGFYAKNNVGDPIDLALWWFEVQGEFPYFGGRFSSNAGRYALARWCQKLNVSYKESFQIHGDLYTTWADHYEDYVPADPHQQRAQSKNPDTATKALSRFAHWLGRGKQVKPKLTRRDRYMHHICSRLLGESMAHRIAHGIPSDDETKDSPELMFINNT